MDLGAQVRRHRVAVASYLALALAVTGVVVYAVSAQGYRAHQTRLNDGGIWVTDNRDSAYGRMNKPIGQLDGAVFAGLHANLDVAQDDSAIIGVNLSGGTLAPLDPSTMRMPPGSSVPIPAAPEVQARGGTVAVLDTATGAVRAARVDTVTGVPDLHAVGREAKPLGKVGRTAALAVSDAGTVVAVSAVTGTLLTSTATSSVTSTGFAPVHTDHLTGRPGADAKHLQVTTVGETPVVLDAGSGLLHASGGADARVPAGSVLQQPGPDAPYVLVESPKALLAVDLGTGQVTTVAGDVSGSPIQPVRLGTCSYAAWSGGQGFVATRCDGGDAQVAGLRTATTDLVFRVNRGQILLNDRGDGAVWNVDHPQPQRIDNWDAFRAAPSTSSHRRHDNHPTLGDRRPPKARDDSFGARPGRATVLHPLDNDSAPEGRLLAIRAVQDVSDPGTQVRISPDGQTVDLTLPPGARGVTTFRYFVDDGRDGVTGHATVRVQARLGDVNAPPALRRGADPRIWNVPATGTLTVPVLADWRDNRDGDAVSLASATAQGGADAGASATTTAGGGVRFQAPDTAGLYRVRYTATDGMSAPVPRTLTFRVESPTGDTSYPAVAEPDVVVGQVGKPVTIKPLLNDLPGADPLAPHARLALAGRVAQPGGAEVDTDLEKGTITLESATAHTYFLDYQAAYGNAKAARGRIRVDVRAPARDPQDPVAMPDQVTLRGTAPSLVDVLANDSDPAGGLLAVQTSTADDATQLDVGVVDGRWLRIAAPRGALAPDPQVVRYQVSDGERSVTGQVVVNWRPEPADDTPVTTDDEVTVRAGNSVAVPVLDNDLSPSGDQLDLVRSVAGQRPGELAVSQEGSHGPTGSAYVVGRQVRYVAPPQVADAANLTVSYVAVNGSGATAPGSLEVTVIPRGKANQPPEPPTLEGRVVSGDVVKLRLPGSGVDPDGDAVTIEGLETPPGLGRILKIGANSIDYQAYPGSVGTDSFRYQVTDSLGAPATGTARVVIAPPGQPQPPLAVADAMTVAPGRTASVDVLANDLVSSGDRVTVSLVDPPDGVSLESPQGPVRIQAPTATGRNETVVYRISNGLDVSQTAVTLTVVPGFNNPPVVFDAFGSTGDGDSVTTDVLGTAYDPDGARSALRITRVLAPQGVRARVVGDSHIRVSRERHPIVVPFVVSDGDGGATTGNLYVPATTGNRPYVKSGALIRVKPGGSATGDLSDLVVDPAGGTVRFTSATHVWTSPHPGLDVLVTGKGTFRIDAAPGYTGPGAISFEVTTAAGVNAGNSRKAAPVVLTVPVQVGEDKPILICPSTSLTVAQSQSVTVDVAALCHVWTIDPAQQSRLHYTASFQGSAPGLTLGRVQGSQVPVRAGGDARPGATAVLEVAASGSEPGRIRVRVGRAAPPRLTPIRVSDLRYGETRTVDLTRYLIPGIRDPRPVVVAATQSSGVPVRITAQGTSVTLRTLKHVHGHATFRIVMSDAGPSAGPERRVQGVLTLDILDVPGAPGRPLTDPQPHDSRVPIRFTPAVANGAPVLGYEVRDTFGRITRCGSTSCDVTGLRNGRTYHFQVRARNAVGPGPWGPISRPAIPQATPDKVSAVRMVEQGDGFLTLAWRQPPTGAGADRTYQVTWTGSGRTITVRTERAKVTGLDNNTRYRFTIRAFNGTVGGGTYVSPFFQPMGKPSPPQQVTATDVPQDGDTAQAQIAWAAVSPNGPEDVRYDVLRDGLAVCQGVRQTSCTDGGMPYDGRTYHYTVTATNKHGAGITSDPSVAVAYQAVGHPAGWGSWDAQPNGNTQEVRLQYTVPDSRGARSQVDVLVSGTVTRTFDERGNQTHTISVPDDDHAYDISLRVCNEFDRCTASGTQSVQAYGPLRGAIASVTANPDGPNMSYTISGNTNGRPAVLTINRGLGFPDEQITLPAGPFTRQTQVENIGYDSREQITVTIHDPDLGRGSDSQSTTGTAAAPPPAHVSITRGALCNDGIGSASPPCQDRGFDPRCTDASCGHVQLTLDSFVDEHGNPTEATCQLTAPDADRWNWLGRTWRVGNGTTDLDAPGYYGSPGNTIGVTCTDGTGNQGQSASSTFQWPSQ